MTNKVGKRFDRLLVIEKDKPDSKGFPRYICRCDCGTIKSIATSHLKESGIRRVKSCGCLSKERKSRFRGHGQIPFHYFSIVQRGAHSRQLEITITIEEAWDLFLKQEGKCALSGIPLQFGNRGIGEPQTASFDRKDSHLGYTSENVQWVHKDVNGIKSDFTDEAFIEWCHKVSDFQRGKST